MKTVNIFRKVRNKIKYSDKKSQDYSFLEAENPTQHSKLRWLGGCGNNWRSNKYDWSICEVQKNSNDLRGKIIWMFSNYQNRKASLVNIQILPRLWLKACELMMFSNLLINYLDLHISLRLLLLFSILQIAQSYF